ncbi:DbpA RNA binding domain-containing protein [Methylobacter sp. S3L5C]|uniref:DbpA RNA binding domain-containing protein n=1 Tax=Methylobacter sp. S3L5C TaxID=2839024 RepID=UPI001FAD1042|nr:DbpA RNA binding domain-containing protein [Methylobacter sp. S3L5C]UOA08379.1 DbpA RNA binding domain-containing protein [Methylobacter sp. S3L5C]
MIDILSNNEPLKNRLQQIISSRNLNSQREFISTLAIELEVDSLTCAAALVHLTQAIENKLPPELSEDKKTDHQLPINNIVPGIKMVRYRLDVGSKHHINLEQLKKVLIEESGVDKNNIHNVNIQSLYTLLELPDEMPPDIFQHLKLVEINQHKLDIRRVKARNNKKRGNNHMRRGRKRDVKTDNEPLDKVNNNKNVD